MVGDELFGASSAFYRGSSYGSRIDGGSDRVRGFTVTGETSRSWIVNRVYKISKKTMAYNTGSFVIEFFKTYDAALASLNPNKAV